MNILCFGNGIPCAVTFTKREVRGVADALEYDTDPAAMLAVRLVVRMQSRAASLPEDSDTEVVLFFSDVRDVFGGDEGAIKDSAFYVKLAADGDDEGPHGKGE
jgi:hypothetical protein